jgi:hypothetical protein
MKRTQHFVVTMHGTGLTRELATRILRAGLRSWGYGAKGGNGTAKVRPLVLHAETRNAEGRT